MLKKLNRDTYNKKLVLDLTIQINENRTRLIRTLVKKGYTQQNAIALADIQTANATLAAQKLALKSFKKLTNLNDVK